MSGYAAAVKWLKENGDEWVIRDASALLFSPPTGGTEERVTVRLRPTTARFPERYGYDVELSGEGATHLAAVQRAIGAYRDAS